MLGLNRGGDQARISNVLPEQDERISGSLDVIMGLLLDQYTTRRFNCVAYLPGVTLLGFGSRNSTLVLVSVRQTVIRAPGGVGTLSSNQVTPRVHSREVLVGSLSLIARVHVEMHAQGSLGGR